MVTNLQPVNARSSLFTSALDRDRKAAVKEASSLNDFDDSLIWRALNPTATCCCLALYDASSSATSRAGSPPAERHHYLHAD